MEPLTVECGLAAEACEMKNEEEEKDLVELKHSKHQTDLHTKND